MNVPVISLEIQSLRHTIKKALTEHAAQMDADLQKAVDDYCREGNISQIIRETARREIDAAVKEEVQQFFRYSQPGREAIRQAVQEHMDEMFPVNKEPT